MAKRKWVFYLCYKSYPRVTWSYDPTYNWWRGPLWNIVDGINNLGCQSPLWQRNGTIRSMSRSCKRSSKRCVRLQWRGEKLSLWKRKLTSKEDFHNVALADSNCVCVCVEAPYVHIHSYLHIRTCIVHKLSMHIYVHIHMNIYIFIFMHHIFIYIYMYLFRYLNIVLYIYISTYLYIYISLCLYIYIYIYT